MDREKREDIMLGLVQGYARAKFQSKAYGREMSESYNYSKGMLSGACMAFELDYEETKTHIKVFTQKAQKVILIYDTENGTCEIMN